VHPPIHCPRAEAETKTASRANPDEELSPLEVEIETEVETQIGANEPMYDRVLGFEDLFVVTQHEIEEA
jgi:hypothetical protein